MTIKSSTKQYQVNIFEDFSVIEHLEIDDKTFVVIDQNLVRLYGEKLFGRIAPEQCYILEALEENKTMYSVLEICERMTNIPAKRNARLISFGGGIVQDVTGVVANLLYRGIKWEFYPTTLLAACDSCIGGKTSLNYKGYKNLLGTFYPPDQINICTPFFKTLEERDFQSGLGEVVKFNIMFGRSGIERMEQNISYLLQRNDAKLCEFVKSSLEFKKDFIEEDEFDKGVRVHLNFAHTFGHAFETVSHYKIPHGTAVAMGTIVANRISLERKWLEEEDVLRIENVLDRIINIDIENIELNIDNIVDAIHKDKKQTSRQITAVLMYDDMKLRIVNDVKVDEIIDAVTYLLDFLEKK